MNTPLRIFLSYGHDANEELVRRIYADLKTRGHDVWFDKSEIKAGDDWRRSITDGILQSHRVLSFLSKHSTRDPGVCRDEIAIAIGVKGGNIQTILVESEQEVQPPVNIGHIQWLDMHDWKERRAAGEAAWEQWYQAKLAEIVRVVESDESRRFAGEIETLNNYLKPIRHDARMYDLLRKGFFGRAWLFDAVENWRLGSGSRLQTASVNSHATGNSPSPPGGERVGVRGEFQSRVFWITGAPGVGKSAFAAQLAHTRSDVVIAAQFCEWDKPDHRDPRRVVRSLAFQLATRLPDYRKLLLTLPEIAELDRKGLAELFDYLLANPLRTVIGGGRDRYLVIIDALDEAGEAERNPLVEMLARHAQRLPDWLGLVITSRPESAVKTPLQGLNPFVLDTRTEANRADLRNYLRRQLAAQLQKRPDADRLIGQILDKSEGVFLAVERFCDDVRRGHLSLDCPEQFPQGLGGIFCQYFQRQFPDLKKFRKNVRPALRAILAAREPLPVDILQRLFNWQNEELRHLTNALGSLFPVTIDAGHEVCKPYHKSLADWLAAETKAGAYYVSLAEGHRLLSGLAWGEYQRGLVFMSTYGRRHLPEHLLELADRERLTAVMTNEEFLGEAECFDSCVNVLTTLDIKERSAVAWAHLSSPCSKMLTATWTANPRGCCELFLAFATACDGSGRWSRAYQVLDWIRTWSVHQGVLDYTLKALVVLAQIESARGNPRDALRLARSAYALAKEKAKIVGPAERRAAIVILMRTMNTLGRATFDMANIDGSYRENLALAAKLFEEVERLAKKEGFTKTPEPTVDRQVARALNFLGVIWRLNGQRAKARGYQERALELRRRHDRPRDLAYSTRDLAWLDWDTGDVVKAGQRFAAALDLSDQAGDPQAQLWLLRDLDEFSRRRSGSARLAAGYRERAYRILAQVPGTGVYYDLGAHLRLRQGRPASLAKLTKHARDWYRKAANWFARRPEPWARCGQANALRGLAWTWGSLGDQNLRRAAEHLDHECNLRLKTGDITCFAQSLKGYALLGYRLIDDSNLVLSRHVFENVEALALAMSPRSPSFEIKQALASAYYGLGNVCAGEGNISGALGHFTKARDTWNDADPAHAAYAAVRVGACYLELRKLVEAESALEEALLSARSWHDAEAETSACRHLSMLYLERSLSEPKAAAQAAEFAKKAIQTALSSPTDSAMQEALSALGDVRIAQKKFIEARRLNREALALARKNGRVGGISRCLLACGLLEYCDGKLYGAQKYCREARNLSGDKKNRRLLEQVHLVEACLKALRRNAGVHEAHEELQRREFHWLPNLTIKQ